MKLAHARPVLLATVIMMTALFLALIAHTADNAHRAGYDAAPITGTAESDASPAHHDERSPYKPEHGEHLDLASSRILAVAFVLLTVSSILALFSLRRTPIAIAAEARIRPRALSITQLSILRT